MSDIADWTVIPKTLFVTSARSPDGIGYDVTMCSVPHALAPEVAYVRADEITRIRAENERLRDLLAIIHRDGGQHTAAVGVCQSVDDAHQRWADLIAEVERLRAALKGYERHMSEMQRAATHYLSKAKRHDEFIDRMLWLLDGPEQRKVQAEARAALAAQPAPKEDH